MGITRRVRWKEIKLNVFAIVLFAAVIYYAYRYVDVKQTKIIICIADAVMLLSSRIFIKAFLYFYERHVYLHSKIGDVDIMTGIEFEYFLKYHFKRMGYRVEMTAVTGDYGADLVLKRKRRKIVVQAKRYRSKVGIKAVQEIIGAIKYYDAEEGFVVTNSYYTPNAINLADANEIELWDRKDLLEHMTGEKY